LLSSDNGGSGDDYGVGCAPDANRTTFDDNAAASVVGQSAPFVGSFRPEEALSGFVGKFGAAVNGNWTLRITDDFGADVGTFYCVSLFLSPLTGFETVSTSLADGNLTGFVDPNECSTFGISLRNVEGVTLTGITGTLTTSTPGVVITQGSSSFPDAASLAVVTNSTPFGIGTTPAFVCGTPVVLDLALAYNGGTDNQTITLYAGTEEYVNMTATALLDLNTTDIPISVSGFTGTLSALTVSLHLIHTWNSDLTISLISPDNTEVILSNRRGGSGDNYGSGCGNPTVFDDAASTFIGFGTSPFAGRFSPEAPLSERDAGYRGRAVPPARRAFGHGQRTRLHRDLHRDRPDREFLQRIGNRDRTPRPGWSTLLAAGQSRCRTAGDRELPESIQSRDADRLPGPGAQQCGDHRHGHVRP
jgi:subtilisin-like proprotein convertase family protein